MFHDEAFLELEVVKIGLALVDMVVAGKIIANLPALVSSDFFIPPYECYIAIQALKKVIVQAITIRRWLGLWKEMSCALVFMPISSLQID